MHRARPMKTRRWSARLATGALSTALIVAPVELVGGGAASAATTAAGQVRNVVVQYRQTGNCQLLTAAVRRQVSGDSSVAGCQKASGKVPKFTIVRVSVSGSTATVTVTAQNHQHSLTLTEIGGHWVINHVSQ